MKDKFFENEVIYANNSGESGDIFIKPVKKTNKIDDKIETYTISLKAELLRAGFVLKSESYMGGKSF